MILQRVPALLIPLFLLGPHELRAQAPPRVASLFPLGGRRGTLAEVELRGAGLDGAHAVWLGPGSRLVPASSCDVAHTRGPEGLRAELQAVPDGSRAIVRLRIASDARIGFHSLGLVTPRGLSGAVAFWVGPDAVIASAATPHDTPETAQPVQLPLAVNGRLTQGGQLDYYAFEVPGERQVAFEVICSNGPKVAKHLALEPQPALYEAGGSFLDPRRPRRLLFHEELTQGGMPASGKMTYHFTKPGRYLVSFGQRLARGGAGTSYLLRIASVDASAAGEDSRSWARRRLRELLSRTVAPPIVEPGLVKEAEPNDDPARATAFDGPAVLEGIINHPGDIDHFRFRAQAGQKLAFEVQAPLVSPPYFNPRLDVLNARGTVVCTSLRAQDAKIGTVNTKGVQLAQEVLGKLNEDGGYTLRVRDLTSLQGGPEHGYRVLVRPQIPHVGAIRVEPDGPVNLPVGSRRRLTLHVSREEEYHGTLAFSVEGLPEGVRAFVGANGSTIDLVADSSAPRSRMPQDLRVWGLPSLRNDFGAAFLVAELPVMVVK